MIAAAEIGAAGRGHLSWTIDSDAPNAEWACSVSYVVKITKAVQSEWAPANSKRIGLAGRPVQSEWAPTSSKRLRLAGRSAQSEWVPTSVRRLRITEDSYSEWNVVYAKWVRLTEQAQAEWFPSNTKRLRASRSLQAEWNPSSSKRLRLARAVQSEWVASSTRRLRSTQTALFEWVTDSTKKLSLVGRLTVSEWWPDFTRVLILVRTADVISEWASTFKRSIIYVRKATVFSEWNPKGRIEIPIDDIPPSGGPVDWPDNDGTRSIAGTVLFHEPPDEGNPVVGATVTLIRDSDGYRVGTQTTDVAGHYVFPRDTNDPYTYHVEVNYTDVNGPQQGLSEGGCAPS